jgi:uridine kinase
VIEALEGLRVPDEGQVILACIEGPGGSGKSTLADQIAQAHSGMATVVHGDDFYGPEERDWRSWTAEEGYLRYFDHRRLEHELLQPLRRGDSAQFLRYDWSTKVRLARANARGENDADWIARWVAAEDHYEIVERPAEAADLIVDGW